MIVIQDINRAIDLFQTNDYPVDELREEVALCYVYGYHRKKISKKSSQEIREFILNEIGIEMDHSTLSEFLDMYPFDKAFLNRHGYLDECRILDIVSKTLLFCTWPTYGDKVDRDEYMDALFAAAEQFGLTVEK